MSSCCFPIAYFFDRPPKLKKIAPDNIGNWKLSTVRKNIKAVPRCHSREDLEKVKEIADQYFNGLTERLHSDANIQEKSLILLKKLSTLADKRLKEIPFDEYDIQFNFQTAYDSGDHQLWVKELEELTECIKQNEDKLFTQNSRVKEISQEILSHKNTLKNLEKIFAKAEQREIKLRLENMMNISNNSTSEKWNIEEIYSNEESISEMNKSDITRLLYQVRGKKSKCLENIFKYESELYELNSSKRSLHSNINLLRSLESELNRKLQKNLSELEQLSCNHGIDIELEECSSDDESLKLHHIKGQTNKTYVALTEEK